MENYNKVKACCENNKCTIITTFDEFEKQRETVLKKSYQYVRIEFIGICGHNSNAVVTNFMCRNTGIKCKDCVKKKTYSTLKEKSKQTNIIESESIKIINSYLSKFYKVIRTKEGCLADLAISNTNINNQFMALQVKSTKQISHGMYSFRRLKTEYRNMLIICVCINENKIWIIPYDEVNINTNLNISLKSKYNKYLVQNNEDINKYIDKYCDRYQNNKLEELNKPQCQLQQREQDYVKKRETYVDCIKYEYPDVQNTSTDFIVNNKKIQEKVCGLYKYNNRKDKYIVWFASNNGTNNKVRKYRTYYIGENDYYWLHSSIDDRFWIIPEMILYEKGFIANKNEIKSKKTMNLFTNNEWLKEYEHNYNNYNKSDIIKLFE